LNIFYLVWGGGGIRHVDFTSGKSFKYAILRNFNFNLIKFFSFKHVVDICRHISLVIQC
jgi:hypothetical protein